MCSRVPGAVLAVGLQLALGCGDQYAAIGVAALELDAGDVAAPGASGDGMPTASAGQGGSAGLDAGAPDAAADMPNADASVPACEHPAVAVCNPVTNTGCPDALMMQCAVDLASTLAGYCIFASPQAQPLDCLNTIVTETCPAGSACVDGQCEQLCFCDSDCEPGLCCNGPIAAHGFSACGDC